MYTSRICPGCKLDRFPEETVVKEGKKSYVLYKCRVCKYTDIERLVNPPKTKLWDAKWGRFEDYNPFESPTDDSNSSTEPGS